MAKQKIKPCPFCGGKAKLNECDIELCMSERKNVFSVRCTVCGCMPFSFSEICLYYQQDWKERKQRLERQAIDAWNRRTDNE